MLGRNFLFIPSPTNASLELDSGVTAAQEYLGTTKTER